MKSADQAAVACETAELFFASLLELWKAGAPPGRSPVEHNLQLCENHLRLCFASGREAALLTRAFQPCRPPRRPSPAPFTIYIFSGRPESFMAALPWKAKEDFEGPRGEIRPFFGPEILAASYLMEIVYICHRKRREAICWFRNPDFIPLFEQAAPFRPILHWWLRENGWLMVHGAGLGLADRGLLLMGKSGSGKSTFSAAAAVSGDFQFLGDDYCAVKTGPEPRLATLFSTAKLSPESCALIGVRPTRTVLEITGKHLFFLSDQLAGEVPESLPLTALVLPETGPADQPAAVYPLTRAQAAIHLSVSSLYQLPHSGGEEFSKLAHLARRLPGWALKVPEHNPDQALPALKSVLQPSLTSNCQGKVK